MAEDFRELIDELRAAERLAIAAGCDFSDIEGRLREGLDRPIEPDFVNTGPVREIYLEGDDVDLHDLPIPLFSVLDGGPMITAGVTLSRDPDEDENSAINAGVYRFLVKEKNLTGIDIVTPNNLHRYAAKAYEKGEPLPISINIGTHPFELICSTYKARAGVSELGIAGGMRGHGVPLTQCQTIDMPCIADAEIVLEAEILPTGWTQPEGRFGEFTRLMGCTGIHMSVSRPSRCARTRCIMRCTCRGKTSGRQDRSTKPTSAACWTRQVST